MADALGAAPLPGGATRFAVWAPRPRAVAVEVSGARGRRVPLARGAEDVWSAVVQGVGAGDDYLFVLDGGPGRPDPRSRWQPRGVHGPSRVVDPRAFAWTDAGWRGLALEKHVIYEVHVGTFTWEGTFAAMIPRLAALRDLGVTAIELMPVAEFPGARNWGYDGVDLYAPQSTYGGPAGLDALVDACHREGLAVILDVVYNHLGPEGNYLPEFAPYFTARRHSPWGDALDFDGPDAAGVRAHFVDNAVAWLEEHHVDGLRLDAVDAIFDASPRHVLEELGARFGARARELGRRAHLFAESDQCDARLVRPASREGRGLDAVWNEDFHHAVWSALTGDRRGYFADFGRVADVGKAVGEGFVHDGGWSRYRGRAFGSSSAEVGGEQLVAYVQNHDQVANPCHGERMGSALGAAKEALAVVALLTAPEVPLLFMGQEYGETAPFHYFVSHGDVALVRAVREGREREHEQFGWRGETADPQAPETFEACKLDPSRATRPPGAAVLALHRDLLALRARCPALGNCRKDLTQVGVDEAAGWVTVVRGDPGASRAVVLLHFGEEAVRVPVPAVAGRFELAFTTAPEAVAGSVVAGDEVALPGWGAAVYVLAGAG